MPALPTGTVTFLFTDIEGSTRLLQALGERYRNVFETHRRLLRAAIEEVGGHEFETQGDGLFVAFPNARDALATAVGAQRALQAYPWPDGAAIRVRMGLHTGHPTITGSGYVGLDLHRTARICTAGHGGQVLLSSAARELVEDFPLPGISFRDLGEYRLKDLSRPQRLFQVVASDLPTDFPPLRSLDFLPNNLPIQLTSFIGREREKAEIRRLLSTTRLLTLTGSGGAGKTRLALQVAAEVMEEFKDGVWVAELASLSDPTLVPKAVASAMNVPEQPGRPLSETLVDSLRSRSLLLLLDNCEHLLPACAHLAEILLRACPTLRMLATSREALDIEGETTYRVPSLSLPDAPSLPLERLNEFEAVRFFIDRATAALPSFMVTSQNAKAVTTICQRLDGIPLALELAAPRIKALSVEHIAERLHDRFRLLTSGRRTALPRQQTLRATMDWSHDLLSEQERVLLRRLSVFAGGFTLEAAEAVCQGQGVNADDVVDLLTHLVEKSLVVFQEQAGRYGLLETVRQYGWEKLLKAREDAAVRGQHRDWYLALAEQADPELRGSRQREWLDRLDAEHDNLRAALEWSRTEAGGAEVGLRLAGALWWFWYMHGHWSEGRRWLDDLLARSSPVSVSALPKVIEGAAAFAWRQDDYGRATALGEKGLALCRELGAKEGITRFLFHLGMVALRQGDYGRATTLFEESLTLGRELGDKWAIGVALVFLGVVAGARGDYERAAAIYTESLALSRQVGDKWLIALPLRGLAIVAFRRGAHRQALAYYKESLDLNRQIRDIVVTESNLEGLAEVAYVLARHEQSARLLGAAEALRETLGRQRLRGEQAAHDKRVASARAALGEGAFAAAWAEGRAMTLGQAIEYALNDAASED